MNLLFKIIAIVVVFALLLRATIFRRLYPVVRPLKIRVDSLGNGHFGSSRSDHTHRGVDYEALPLQMVHAPFSGTITRFSAPYPGDNRYNGVVIETPLGVEAKIFYVSPGVSVGQQVRRGDVIGIAQDLSLKYGKNIKNHVHVELRKDGALLNPENFF